MDGDPLDGLPAERLAKLTGASLVTARRWKRTRHLPPPVRRLLAILVTGDLGPVDSTWCGWHLARGLLCGPDGLTFEPGEVLAIPFVRAQVQAYQREERYRPEVNAERLAEILKPLPDYGDILAPGIARRRRKKLAAANDG